jgi:hypothetical protein
MINIAIWAIVVPLGAIACIVWHGLKITRAQHQSTMAARSSLGDTHRLGYVALNLAMQRLEKRVKDWKVGDDSERHECRCRLAAGLSSAPNIQLERLELGGVSSLWL